MKEPIQSGGEAMPETTYDAVTPILRLARRLADAGSAYSKAESVASAAKKGGLPERDGVSLVAIGNGALLHFYDEELMARAAISMHKAECLEDAVVQVAEALIHFDSLWDQFPQEAETFHIKQDQRAILRLLYSVFDFLDGIAPRKIAETFGPAYSSPHLSPWYYMEEIQRQEDQA